MRRNIGLLLILLASISHSQEVLVEFAARRDYPRQIEMPSGTCLQVGVYLSASGLPDETFTDLTVPFEFRYGGTVFVGDPEVAITPLAADPTPGFTSPPTLQQGSNCDPVFTYNSIPDAFNTEFAPAQGSVDPSGTTAMVTTTRPFMNSGLVNIQLSNPTGLVDPSIGFDRALIAVVTFELRTTDASPNLPRRELLSVEGTIPLLSSSTTNLSGFSSSPAFVRRSGSEMLAQAGFEGDGAPQTFSYRSLPLTEVTGSYSIGDEITGTITFSPPLTPNRASLQFPFSNIVDFELSDGLRTLTPDNAQVVGFSIGTNEAGIPDAYAIGIWELPIPSTSVSGLDLFQLPEVGFFSDDVFLEAPCTLTGNPPTCPSVVPPNGTSYGVTAGSGTWTPNP